VTTSALGHRPAGRGRRDAAGADREGGGDDRPGRFPASLVLAGIRAAGTAAGAGLAVVTTLAVIGWITAPRLGISLVGVIRTATVIWLVGHHVTVQVRGAGRIGMLPLGLAALPGFLLWRAGRSVARIQAAARPTAGDGAAGPGHAIAISLAVAVPYALLAGVLAVASRSALASASVWQAVIAAFAVAAVAAGIGAARALGPWSQHGARTPPRTRSVVTGSVGSLAVFTAAGSLATAMTLASHLHQFTASYRLLGPGLAGSGLLLLAQLAYLPNAVIWSIAYMLGPGFAVGTGTVVAPTGSVTGRLPAFPLLSALPLGGHGTGYPWLTTVILAVPYLAGVVGGLLVARQAPSVVVEGAPIRGFVSGAVTGMALGVLAAFAGGPLGDGRMSAVGPSPWQVTVVATLEVGISAAISAWLANWRYARTRWPDGRLWRAGLGEPDEVPDRSDEPWESDVAADESDGHVIYLDKWAADTGDGASGGGRSRPGGPGALP
jgi:hypothetical protein